MIQYPYDPAAWLLSLTRGLEDYVTNGLQDLQVDVEMSFPDTVEIEKKMPLAKTLVHMDIDDREDRMIGFGSPGVEVYDEASGKVSFHEASWHSVNYDVGVWASAESGGETARLVVAQRLIDLFSGAGGQRRIREAVGQIQIVSFNGGRFLLDRINDILVWRAVDMTLVVRVFSRRVPPETEVAQAVEDFDQVQNLTIAE
jgi:hypothetical protein